MSDLIYVPKIEFVCTANCGRSVPAEIFANEHLKRIGKHEKYLAISSGSGVDDIKAGRYSVGFKKSIIEKGLRDGHYHDASRKFAEDIVRRGDLNEAYENEAALRAVMDDLFKYSVGMYVHNEHQHRFIALSNLSLEHLLAGKEEKQTVARGDVIAVLPMAKRNLEAVRKIYEASEYRPPTAFAVLKAYVTGNPDDEVADAFGEPEGTYPAMFKELRPLVTQSVDKAIKEFEASQGSRR